LGHGQLGYTGAAIFDDPADPSLDRKAAQQLEDNILGPDPGGQLSDQVYRSTAGAFR